MQKKKNTKFRVTDFLIILLCFAGTSVSDFAFWREYNRTLIKLNEEPVGSVVFKNRTAHRKIENRVAWDRLKQESPVYNGDTIRTAEASEAFITFEDSVTKINLYENTLIQIFYDGRETRIDSSGGNFDVNSGAGSVFIAGGVSTIELEGDSHASLKSGGESFNLSMFKGKAKLDNGAELEDGGMLSFLNDGTLDTSPAIAVTSFGPFARVMAPAGGAASVLFTWNTVNFGPDTRVILDVARDKGFSRIVESRDVSGASSASVSLEAGNYWWRVYPVEGAGGEMPGRGYASGRIETFPFAAVTAIAPSPQREFTFAGETHIPFSWTIVDGAELYLLEVSGDQSMDNPVVSRRIQGTSVVQDGLEPGRWYWRVTPVFPEQVKGTAFPSETGVFSVVRNSAAPEAPSLNIPAQDGIISIKNPFLSWKHDPGAVLWTVEVADNPQMTNPLIRQESVSNFYSLPAGILREDNVYFWRVISRGTGNEESPSQVRSFTAKENLYRQKAVFPPDNYLVAKEGLGELRFTYKTDVPSQNYFQVSPRDDFSSLAINEPTDGDSHSVSGLDAGTWYWRIYADDESGPAASVPRRLNVVSTSEAPRIAAPVSLSQGTNLELDWDSLYFDFYQIDIYGVRDPVNPVEHLVTEDSRAVFSTSSLEPGEYIVSVAGFNQKSAKSARISGTPSQARFTLRSEPPRFKPVPAVAVIPEPVVVIPEPAVIPPPVPVEPEPVVVPPPQPTAEELAAARFASISRFIPESLPPDGYSFSTEQLADASSINFVWKGNVPEYRFTLYRANGEVVLPPSVVNAPSFTLQNPRILEPGDYVWEIIERDRRGNLGEFMASRFKVTEGPVILRTLPATDPGVLYGNR